MDKMKQEVKGKLQYWRRMSALFSLLLITNCWNYFKPANGGENFTDFFNGFQLGIACALALFAAYNIAKFMTLLKDEEKLRNWYIKEHDERTAEIWAKSGGTVIYTCGVLLIGAAIVAGYFNTTVFITLLSSGIFLLLVKKGLLIYYCKTM